MDKSISIPLSILGFYMIIVLFIGVIPFTKKRINNFNDFYNARSSMNTFFVALCIVASFYTSSTWSGWYDLVFEEGVLGIYVIPYVAITGTLFYYLSNKIYPLGKKNNFFTMTDLIDYSYNSKFLSILVSGISIILGLLVVIIEINTTGYIIQHLTKGYLSFHIGTMIGLFLVILYVLWGGIESIVFTDAIQALIMIIGSIIICFLVVKYYFADIHEFGIKLISLENYSTISTTNSNSMLKWLSLTVISSASSLCWPQMFNRIYMGKDSMTIKRGSIFLSISSLWCVTFIFCAFIGRVLDLSSEAFQILTLVKGTKSTIALSLTCVFLIAAAMGTLDTTILSISTIINKNILPSFNKKYINDYTMLNTSKFIVVGVAIFSYILTFLFNGINLMSTVIIGCEIIAQLFPLLFIAVYSKYTNTNGAIISFFMSLIVILLFSIIGSQMFHPLPGFIALLINLSLNIIFTANEYMKRNEKFVIENKVALMFFSVSYLLYLPPVIIWANKKMLILNLPMLLIWILFVTLLIIGGLIVQYLFDIKE